MEFFSARTTRGRASGYWIVATGALNSGATGPIRGTSLGLGTDGPRLVPRLDPSTL